MSKRIERDAKRYREIVKGKVRRDLGAHDSGAEDCCGSDRWVAHGGLL